MAHEIVLLGIDYRRAPLEVREELSFNREQTLALLPQLRSLDSVREAVMLATCNRTEFYLAYEGESPVQPALELLRRVRSGARALHEDCHRFVESNDQAAHHLFRVTAGIDSQILGDTNIVTQVKEAHRIASEAKTLGAVLDRTFTEGLRAAKRARSETDIGRGASSVGGAVLRSIRRAFAEVRDLRVLVLGAGEAGRDIAGHLSKVRFAELAFSARSEEQAARMAREFRGCTKAWEDLAESLASADVLVAAASARLEILKYEPLRSIASDRSRPLLIVDAGVPRNADPSITELRNIRLLNLDDLTLEQEQALATRRAEIPRVEAILAQEMDRWRSWRRRSLGSSNTRIAAAHRHSDAATYAAEGVVIALAGQDLHRRIECRKRW